jgi:hypothetical protein
MSQCCFLVESFYAIAAQSGHLHILQWLYDKGYPWDKDTCAGAKEKGHQHILDWIHANGCPCDCNE